MEIMQFIFCSTGTRKMPTKPYSGKIINSPAICNNSVINFKNLIKFVDYIRIFTLAPVKSLFISFYEKKK